jgi:hypothetical protein
MVDFLRWLLEPLDRWIWAWGTTAGFILQTKGGAPKAPDPQATAQAQTQSNLQTALANAQLNRINQVGPLGNLTYSNTPTFDQGAYNTAMADYDAKLKAYNAQTAQSQPRMYQSAGGAWLPLGGSSNVKAGPAPVAPKASDFNRLPSYTATTSLPQAAQNALNTQMGIDESLSNFGKSRLDSISAALSRPYDFSGFTPLPNTDREAITSAMMARQEPQFARDEQSLRQQLNNQGITETSNPEAWGREMERLDQAKNDARNQAYIASGTEAFKDMQTSLAGRGQQVNEMNMQRQVPMNELNQLLGMAQVQLPNYNANQPTNVGDVPVGQYVNNKYQGDVANYNAGIGQQNALLSTLGMLGAAWIGV